MTAAGDSAPSDAKCLMDSPPMSGLQKRVVALCCTSTFLDGYDTQALGLAVPRMAEEWALSPSAFGTALSGSLLGIALGAVLLAPLADRFGRRPTLVAMMLIVGVTTLGAAFATSPAILAVWRIATGLGLGGSVPVATAMTSEYAPVSRRAALIAVMIACMALGSFAAGIVAPGLSHAWGWRGIFGLGAVLPIAMAALLWVALPESLQFLLARGGSSSLIEQPVLPGSPESSATATAATPKRVDAPRASVRDLFGPPYWMRTVLVWVIFWFNLFVIYSLISWVPTLLRNAGWAHDSAQRASGLVALGGIAGGVAFAWIADRGYPTTILFIAYVGSAVILSLFAFSPVSTAAWIVLLILVGAGTVGGQMAAGSVAAAHYYPSAMRSTGVGWFNGVSRTGAIAGPLVVAQLLKMGLASVNILGLLAVPMLVCAGVVLLLPRALAVRHTGKPESKRTKL